MTGPLLACLLVWLFMLGATVGSFLNVVVYRLPAGLSVVYPSSRCPVCGAAIRARDNIPILSWLALRGRCRDCQAPIPLRYCLVELGTAILFVALALIGPLAASSGLDQLIGTAGPAPQSHGGPSAITWIQYVYRLLLPCALLCAALIEYDGFVLPRRAAGFILAIALVSPLLHGAIRPAPCQDSLTETAADQTVGDALAEGTRGMGAGLLLGLAVLPANAWKSGFPSALEVAWALCLVGVILGWQAVAVLAPLAAVLDALGRLAAGRRKPLSKIGWIGWLTVATLLFLFGACLIERHMPALASQASAWNVVAAVSVVTVCSYWSWKLDGGRID